MTAAFDALTGAILPIFAVPFLGWWLGRRGTFDRRAAEGINRFVVLLALPALMVSMLAGTDLSALPPYRLAQWLVVDIVVYGLGLATARFGFGAGWREALLLGMATAFANHVFFVLPIAVTLNGPAIAAPIAAIIALDSIVLFAGTVVVLDLAGSRGSGLSRSIKNLAANPLLVAIGIGIGLNVLGVRLHRGVEVFTDFAGASAAPASLFALGIILGAVPLNRLARLPAVIAALKLAVHPLLIVGVVGGIEQADLGARAMLLVAAGPCGAMPFVIALRYGVAAERIALAIIYSTLASLGTLMLIA